MKMVEGLLEPGNTYKYDFHTHYLDHDSKTKLYQIMISNVKTDIHFTVYELGL